MHCFIIYKQTYDKDGNLINIDLIENCETAEDAKRYSRLYFLQTTQDIKDCTEYKWTKVKIY